MVSLTEIRNRPQPSFTADQAELIANLHVEMHDQLVARQDFAELRDVVEPLADSQQELVEAQHRTEHVIGKLATSVTRSEYAIKDLAKQVGGLTATAGSNPEAYASGGSESIEAAGKAHQFDAVLRGTIDGRPVVVLCELKTNISESEVRGFLRIVDRVRPTVAKQVGNADVRPLFFVYQAAIVTQKLVTESGAWLVFPRGLAAAA